jgi:hypothetical protein
MRPAPPPGSVVCTEGPTPHGGVASLSYFLDDAGQLVPKDRATRLVVYELDAAGDVIHRVSVALGRPPGGPVGGP